VDLTDNVKDYVLRNRVYRPPPAEPSVTQCINNNIMINNYIASLDTFCKLDMVLEQNNMQLKSLDRQLRDQFEEKREQLESEPRPLLRKVTHLDLNELLKTIDVVSRLSNCVSEFNLMLDSKNNKLRMYDGEWDDHLLEKGLGHLIDRIQEYYWDSYEEYLIHQIYVAPEGLWEAQRSMELLEEYYKFLACFKVEPYAKNKSDALLGVTAMDSDEPDVFDTSETLMKQYRKLRDELRTGEVRDCRNKVLDILKRSTASNMETLNCKVLELFHMDPAFKQSVLNSVTLPGTSHA
jgi:hypothetical protein